MRDRVTSDACSASSDEPGERDDLRPVAIPADLTDQDRRRLLRALGGAGAILFAGQLSSEAIGTATAEDGPYELLFVDDDEETTVEVDTEEEILYPALDADVEIPYECEVGTCGECTARYDGDATDVVSHDGNEYLSNDQIEEGWILTCVAYAGADFELEVAHPDDE